MKRRMEGLERQMGGGEELGKEQGNGNGSGNGTDTTAITKMIDAGPLPFDHKVSILYNGPP